MALEPVDCEWLTSMQLPGGLSYHAEHLEACANEACCQDVDLTLHRAPGVIPQLHITKQISKCYVGISTACI